jgi:hypothetical protein
MESGLRVGEGGSGGCDETKQSGESSTSAIMPLTLPSRKGSHRPLIKSDKEQAKRETLYSQADSKVWCSSSLSAFLTASDIFVFGGWWCLKKEGERGLKRERFDGKKHGKEAEGFRARRSTKVVVLSRFKGRRRICCLTLGWLG